MTAKEREIAYARQERENQEKKMQQLLAKEQEKQRKIEMESQRQILKQVETTKKREWIKNLGEQFKTWQPNPNQKQMEVHIRLPSGKRIQQNFEITRQIGFIKEYIWQIPDNGIFEEDDEDEDIQETDFHLVNGFPPKKMPLEQTLEELFPEEDGVAFLVRVE